MDHLFTQEWLSNAREVWGQAWPGYVLIAVAFCGFLWFLWRLPPPGYAITAMALVAGVMALRPDMGGWEKSLWFVVLLFLAGVEIRAITKDRKEQTKTFSDIAAQLAITVNQGTTALNALTEATKEGRTHFDSTVSGLTDSIKTQTGGDSFCYLEFTQALNDVGGMLLIKVGKYPLRGISARIMDAAKTAKAISEFTKTHPPTGDRNYADQIFAIQRMSDVLQPVPDFATDTRSLGGYQMTKSDWQSFQILFTAFNGTWIERMEIRTVGEKWVKAIMVEVPMTKQYRHFFIDSDYPRVNGKLDVPSWPRPVRGKPEWEK